ncbi:MAG: toll/interleukin-1 receptor domain-containing protein [Acidobacteria bacterium]|nr:toll/interleukin-1 receptor domain-containing protein [Acidobacteriota bacterium]
MQVFLSYSDADRDFARRLASQLSKRGCEVWDPSEQLFPGDNWPLKIGEALKQSKAMVVLLSPDSMKSQWVRREIEYALGDRNYKGRLFPVLVRPAREIPSILRELQVLPANDPANVGDAIAAALSKERYPALSALLARRKRKRATAL